VPIIIVILNKTWIFSTGFRKIIKSDISWKFLQWSRVFPCGRTDRQTDRHYEKSKRFS